MEMRQGRVSVYKRMMRRITFTKWANFLLSSVDKQTVDVFSPRAREYLDRVLQIALAKSEKKFRVAAQETRSKQRGIILNKAETLKKNYFNESQGQDAIGLAILQFIWDLIEYFHISPWKHFWENEEAPKMNAKEVLLKWLNSKLNGRTVTNFTTDWNDGTVLCELINALEPGLIAQKLYQQGSWPKRNVAAALETAEKTWGIPEIITPEDMTCSEVDELSVMTYVSLIFEHDLQRWSTNHADTNSQDSDLTRNHVPVNINKQNSRKIEDIHRKKPDIGKIGKVMEYRLNLHDVRANEITVSVEFKPAGKLKYEYKPDLRVFSLGKGRFRVKYTPNHAGNYRLSMYYKGEHIADSPYCLNVPPLNFANGQENKGMDPNNNSGKKGNDTSSPWIPPIDVAENETLVAKGGFYGFDGEGLKRATVGKLAVFTLITDNRDKGPLSVCINCPAVSIPVPHVKTTNSIHYSTHKIAYMPTLAGTYNIYVRWGLKLINGSPFQVEVSDHDTEKPEVNLRKGSENYNKKRQSTEFSHIRVYYSESSLDPDVIRHTTKLEKLLAAYGITRGSCDDTWVSVDVELEKDERDLIFRLAGTRRLPLMFIHEKCLGGYEEVRQLDQLNELEKCLRYKVRKV